MTSKLRVSGHSFLESVEVELILDEILVNLAEEEVVFKPAKPLDPSHIGVLAEL